MSDYISRADAIDALYAYQDAVRIIKALPSAEATIGDYPNDLVSRSALMEYCSNQKSKSIDNNDIARFPSVDAVSREFYEDAVKANHGLAKENSELKAQLESASDAYMRGFDDCKRAYEIELARSADRELANLKEEFESAEVVRCKDCKWKTMYYNDDESFYCNKTGIINMHIEDGDDEFWCKYGERGEL